MIVIVTKIRPKKKKEKKRPKLEISFQGNQLLCFGFGALHRKQCKWTGTGESGRFQSTFTPGTFQLECEG